MKMKLKNKTVTTVLCMGLAAGLFAGCASDDEKGEKGESGENHDNQAQLMYQAKISKDDAEEIAQSKVPNGTIKESELERENGHLQWSFDMAVPGEKDITEVNIDAITGQVLNIGHEAPDAD
jgi:uncharacterized membrane protein YkoI